MPEATLIYLLYGNSREYNLELTYSVLSAVHHARGGKCPRLVLMTDESGRRSDLPVEHFIFSARDFNRWTDGGRYKHAAKGHAYKAAVDHFGGSVVLADTDTYFVKSPSLLFERTGPAALMHADEGTLENQWPGYWDKIVHECREKELFGYRVGAGSRMYNSGVIGTAAVHKDAIDDVIRLIDALYAIDPRVHNVEQFAYALAFEKFGINTCNDVLRHYYGYERRFVHWRLAKLLPEFTAECFEAALRDFKPVGGYPAKAKVDLARAKLKRFQRRQTSIYGFAYLSYLSALRATEPALANAWANASLDALVWNKFPRGLVAADYSKMAAERLDSISWMDDATRRRWADYWQG